MIKYALVCDAGHRFDSWFANSEAYDAQAERGLVQCAICQSTKVAKAIMAPALGRVGEMTNPPATPVPEPAPLLDPRQTEIRAMLSALRAEMMASTIDVGRRFSEEVRLIHDGEKPDRPIRGQATLEEAQALLAEGIGVMPLPPAPEELN